nr:Fur family transcriptional regulator [uncultured Desulfuromonas sp.]
MIYQQTESCKTFEQSCRDKNLRVTPQRIEIYKELVKAKDHPTAETLHNRLLKRMPTLSLDTVYRTLGTLAEHGLIHKVDTTESQAHFEADLSKHHHAICSQCGRIFDFDWPVVDESKLPDDLQRWGQIDRRSLIVHGICHDCQSKH